MQKYDVVILGGGPGGYVAAIRATQLNMKVALVEKEHLGGICLNWGCIPTKALLKTAEVYNLTKNLDKYGVTTNGKTSVDLQAVVTRSRNIASQLATGVKTLLKKNKVDVFYGIGKIKNNNQVVVVSTNETVIQSRNIVIATGAHPKTIEGFEPDSKLIWTYKEAMTPKMLPKSLIIVGSGAIGIEFASFYNCLGVDVTVIEAQSSILPIEDKEISLIAQKSFQQRGIKFFTEATIESTTKSTDSIRLKISHQGALRSLQAERLMMAVGIAGNVEGIGIENTKIKVENSSICTNEYMATTESNIYAIGDVAGGPCLAHKASHEGVVCIEHMAGLNPHPLDKSNIPGCIYSMPQIASVGLTEAAAKKLGYSVKVGKFPFAANGKAVALSESEGLIKTIFDDATGELLGVHMVGAEVTELIHSCVIAKTLETTESELINAIFPHPTLSEMLHESILTAYNRPLHIFKG